MTCEKSRGRIEIRELWVVPSGELGPYLSAVWGWHDVQQIGRVRRRRQLRRGAEWTEEWATIATSLAPTTTTPRELLALRRRHWVIENRVHRVRDVSFDEDRLHGRQRAAILAAVRNIAISIFRWRGFRYVPDGWRFASANLHQSLCWLL